MQLRRRRQLRLLGVFRSQRRPNVQEQQRQLLLPHLDVAHVELGSKRAGGKVLSPNDRLTEGEPMPNPLAGPVLSDDPVRTIDRDELRKKLDRGDPLKLVMCLNE